MESKCKCSAVTTHVNTGEHNCINCHCKLCRGNHGSEFTTWASVSADKIAIPNDAPIAQYSINENSSSYFCTQCGTKVCAKDSRYPNTIAFLAGTVFDVVLKSPTGDYFYSDKASWYIGENNIPKFGGVSGFEKLEKHNKVMKNIFKAMDGAQLVILLWFWAAMTPIFLQKQIVTSQDIWVAP